MKKIKQLLLLLILFKTTIAAVFLEQENIPKLFEKINREFLEYNALGAAVSWELLQKPTNSELPKKMAEYQKEKLTWQHTSCETMASLEERQMLNGTEMRTRYILCRGPIYTYDEYRQAGLLFTELGGIYQNAEVCIPKTNDSIDASLGNYVTTLTNYIVKKNIQSADFIETSVSLALEDNVKTNTSICLKGDPDLESVMLNSRNEEVLRFSWMLWRAAIGPMMKEPYLKMIEIDNRAARRNGYNDIGAAWRDEIEFNELKNYAHLMYNHVQPLYTLIHGVMRYFLRKKFGDIVPERGLIPAHLLGDLWSQNWKSKLGVIYQEEGDMNVNMRNWTALDMMKHAEDFYKSLGFPAMPDKFWNTTVIHENNVKCYAATIDMFADQDYRMYTDCKGKSLEDLFKYHQEMGNIQYSMASEGQPGILRNANPFLRESVANAIVHGVHSIHHLHRLGLVNDTYLYLTQEDVTKEETTKEAEDTTTTEQDQASTTQQHDEGSLYITKIQAELLKMALMKIPQIPFSIAVDEYRWKLFEGLLNKDNVNLEFWELAKSYQGISPSGDRGAGELFDIAAHITLPGSIPNIRHYLNTFTEMQIFEELCKVTVFGDHKQNRSLPSSIILHRCDIYGSKPAGKVLRSIMAQGNSRNWIHIINSGIGTKTVSSSSFDRYYEPLKTKLEKVVTKFNIPLGW